MTSSLTYPVPAIADADSLTTDQIHALLRNQNVLARRVRTLASQHFIADALLTGRYVSVAGAVAYENGDPLFIDDDPEVVAPGGEYPGSQANEGDLGVARVDKWGRDVPITDESIKRRGQSALDKSLSQLVNRMVKAVDSAALGVIASKVTATQAASGSWTTAKDIIQSVGLAQAAAEASGEGHTLDTVVLTPAGWAKTMAVLLDAGLLPREAANPLITGQWPQVLDLTWLRSAHTPSNVPLLVDTAELGGMADEKLGGPGYAGAGVETKAIRRDETDGYLLRARRVTVPVVTDPTAGMQITGTGL